MSQSHDSKAGLKQVQMQKAIDLSQESALAKNLAVDLAKFPNDDHGFRGTSTSQNRHPKETACRVGIQKPILRRDDLAGFAPLRADDVRVEHRRPSGGQRVRCQIACDAWVIRY